MTGFSSEIGFKVLNKSNGPAISNITPTKPNPPMPNLKYFGTGRPNG